MVDKKTTEVQQFNPITNQTEIVTEPTEQSFGNALVTALVIIGMITGLTFVIVLCYKYHCIKALVVYLMFAVSMLLSYEPWRMLMTTAQPKELARNTLNWQSNHLEDYINGVALPIKFNATSDWGLTVQGAYDTSEITVMISRFGRNVPALDW
jgi:type IV secretory pathway VirB3-like protein